MLRAKYLMIVGGRDEGEFKRHIDVSAFEFVDTVPDVFIL